MCQSFEDKSTEDWPVSLPGKRLGQAETQAGSVNVLPPYGTDDGECNLAAAWGATHFTHVVVVEKLVLSIVPFDPDARPIASRDRSPIRRAVMPRDALADF